MMYDGYVIHRDDFSNFNKGALGTMSESGCGPFAAISIFLKMEA